MSRSAAIENTKMGVHKPTAHQSIRIQLNVWDTANDGSEGGLLAWNISTIKLY